MSETQTPAPRAFTSIVQILRVNEARSGTTKEGRAWSMQDAECVLLTDAGEVGEVGVLPLPKDLMGLAKPGLFTASFALRANKGREGGRKIEAVLTSLIPHPGFGKRAAG